MAKGDEFWRKMEQRRALREAEESGQVADSLEVRKGLIARMKAGEMTLAEIQEELRKIQRGAHRRGLVTRAQAYQGK